MEAKTQQQDIAVVVVQEFEQPGGEDPVRAWSEQTSEDDIPSEEEEALARLLQDWPVYGLCNISVTHPSGGLENKVTKLAALLLLVVQVTIPITLFVSKYREYDRGFCPDEADASQKLLFASIACVYFVRTAAATNTRNLERCTWKPQGPLQHKVEKLRDESGVRRSALRFYGQIDSYMATIFDGGVYLLNLWLLFLEAETLNMILYTLAMEFVVKLDDEFKEIYFKYNGRAVREIIQKSLHKKPIEPKGFVAKCLCCCIYPLLIPLILLWDCLNLVMWWAVPFLSLYMAVFGAVCK